MKRFLGIIGGWSVVWVAWAGALTDAPAKIELPDQYEQMQRLEFPNTNITVLTLADRKGSEQISGWVEPLSHRFGKRIQILGIADVSAVPRLLRGTVRSGFRRDIPHPVMMDWSGATIQKFAPKADVTTVLLMDGHGKILHRCEGAAAAKQIEALSAMIEKLLLDRDGKAVGKP